MHLDVSKSKGDYLCNRHFGLKIILVHVEFKELHLLMMYSASLKQQSGS